MSSTTPQDRAVETLHEKFDLTSGMPSLGQPTITEMRRFTPATSIGPSKLDFRYLSVGEIVDCLADAGLLCSSPDAQPQKEGQGRSAPGTSALTGETRWAVLNEDDDEIYDDREDATRALSFLREADTDHRLYEIREVDRG